MATREAILAFVDRVAKDSEFREWYANSPDEALACYGMNHRELGFLYRSLDWEYADRSLAEALRPVVDLLLETASTGSRGSASNYDRLTAEVGEVRGRIAEALARQREARPWWKFW